MSRIRYRKFRAAMDAAGLGKVELWKDRDYFWIYSDDPELADKISSLNETGIYTSRFSDYTVDEWINIIRELVKPLGL